MITNRPHLDCLYVFKVSLSSILRIGGAHCLGPILCETVLMWPPYSLLYPPVYCRFYTSFDWRSLCLLCYGLSVILEAGDSRLCLIRCISIYEHWKASKVEQV